MRKLIPLNAVLAITGQGRTAHYAGVAAGSMPRPCKVGSRSLWVEEEIFAWVGQRIAERDDAAAVAAGRAAARGAAC